MDKPTKLCPFCGKEILAVAKKCKHCGKWLESADEVSASSITDVTEEANVPYEASTTNTSIVYVLILLIGALIIIICGLSSYK